MAMILKTQHGLLAFRVAFEAVPGEPMLKLAVERFEQGEQIYNREWLIELSSTNIPDLPEDGPAPPLRLPSELMSELPTAFVEAAANEREPIWLHLVKPYGYLGSLPWEAMLRDFCPRPVFRLPDFLENPREDSSVLEAALLWDIPRGSPSDEMLRQLAALWLDEPHRSVVRVHVFCTDPRSARFLMEEPREGLTIHQPAAMMDVAASATGSRYLDWVRESVAPAAIDAVHMVAGATFDLQRSSLRLSAEKGSGTQPVTFLSPPEIASFLNQVGAWSFVLSGPPNRQSGVALRHFADAVAQTRPGPAIYHPLRQETVVNELAPLLRLLFSKDVEGCPALRHAFAYCQPGLVCKAIQVSHGATIPCLDEGGEQLEWDSSEGEQTPAWAASVQRVVEEYGLECAREASGDVLLRNLLTQPPELAIGEVPSEESVIQRTLKEVQSIVQKNFRSR